jgi:hypothetical protein
MFLQPGHCEDCLEAFYTLLTDREKEVPQLSAEGKSNKEAASQLLSVRILSRLPCACHAEAQTAQQSRNSPPCG